MLLDLLLPRTCPACDALLGDRDSGPVCGSCWTRCRALPHPRCDRCGYPRVRDPCRWCDMLPPYVRAARSVCWIPGGTAASIVHALKYGGWHSVAEPMAQRMSRIDWPADVIAERRAVVPVPLAPARERERGFNQSTVLAAALAPLWGVPLWEDVLSRVHSTATQTRLTPEDRHRNVSGAFRADHAGRARLRGAHLVLVDDVVTTGATLIACARALLEGGARVISFVTFGRAPALGDPS